MLAGFQIVRITGSTADTYLEYIQRNLPEGMAMKITTVSSVHAFNTIVISVCQWFLYTSAITMDLALFGVRTSRTTLYEYA